MVRKKGANEVSAPGPPASTAGSLTKTLLAMQTRKNGILDAFSSKPPTNLEDIRKRYARSRGTASPTESEYKRYVNTVGAAVNEAIMIFKVSGNMLKEYDGEGYHQAFNQAFPGFPKDVGFNSALIALQPDFVEGPEMQEYLPFPVDEHVSGAVFLQR